MSGLSSWMDSFPCQEMSAKLRRIAISLAFSSHPPTPPLRRFTQQQLNALASPRNASYMVPRAAPNPREGENFWIGRRQEATERESGIHGETAGYS